MKSPNPGREALNQPYIFRPGLLVQQQRQACYGQGLARGVCE
jgi:hypothetical protein